MGRAIAMEDRQDEFDRRLKLVEEALEELLQNGTRVHHVDLHDKEEFTPPVGKRKKTKKVEKSNAEAQGIPKEEVWV